MALTATEIGSIVQELAPALTEGWIQKVTQPLPDVLLLEIRDPSTALFGSRRDRADASRSPDPF